MSMAWRNIIAALGLIAFGAVYAVLAAGLPERSLPNTPGPSFFPLLIIAFVVALSVALLLSGVLALRLERGPHFRPVTLERSHLAIACFVIYLALLPFAGFVLASIVFFAALMVLYGARNHIVTAITSVAVPVVLFVIFRYGFKIVLPRGLLPF